MLFVALTSNAQTYSGTGPVTLSVPATATSVVWYKDGAVMAGQTATTYSTSAVGSYYATYTDGATACTSDRSITFVLANAGTNVTLNGLTNNGAGTNYQWYNVATAIASATTSNYTTSSGGQYQLKYNNGSCVVSTESNYVFLLTTPISLNNTCPANTVNLLTAGALAGSPPVGTTLTWHTATPATALNKVPNAATVGAGSYYAAFEDASNNCYSPTMEPVTVTINTCANPLTITQPIPQTGLVNTPKSGVAPTDLIPTNGTGTITYSNGSGDALCVQPSGTQPLPASSNLTINATTGAYSYTTPSAAGTYYFCVKVCDSSTPTPECKMAIYQVTVTATASPLTITQPTQQIGLVNTPKSGTAPTDLVPTGGTGAITYSNGSTDPLCV